MSNDEDLNEYQKIDAILFDPTIAKEPKLAALVALRRENKKPKTANQGLSWASNKEYAAALGSTDERAGKRARDAAEEIGLIAKSERSGKAPLVQVNHNRIYSIHQRLKAESASRKALAKPEWTPTTDGGGHPLHGWTPTTDDTPTTHGRGTPTTHGGAPPPPMAPEPASNPQENLQEGQSPKPQTSTGTAKPRDLTLPPTPSRSTPAHLHSGRINGAELDRLVKIVHGSGIVLRTDEEERWLQKAEERYGADYVLCAIDKLEYMRSKGFSINRFPKAFFDALDRLTPADVESFVKRGQSASKPAASKPQGISARTFKPRFQS